MPFFCPPRIIIITTRNLAPRTSEGNWFCTDQILSANIYEHFFYNYLMRLLRSSWMTIIFTQTKHKKTRVGELKSKK